MLDEYESVAPAAVSPQAPAEEPTAVMSQEETFSAPPSTAVPANAPPIWKDVKSSPQYQAASPDAQLVAWDRWHKDTSTYASTLPDWEKVKDLFNSRAAETQKELRDRAGGSTPDAARYRIAQQKLAADPNAILPPDIKAVHDAGPPLPTHDNVAAQFLQSAGQGVGGILKAFAGIDDWVDNGSDSASMERLRSSPAYQFGEDVAKGTADVYRTSPEYQATIPGQLAAGAGGLAPIVAAGFLTGGAGAAGAIGMQTFGDQLDAQYDRLKAEGKSDQEASQEALSRAATAGSAEALLWAVLPHALRSGGDAIIDALGAKGVRRFVLGRVMQGVEGGTMGLATGIAENIATKEEWSKGAVSNTGGLAVLQALMPRGFTAKEAETAKASAAKLLPEIQQIHAEAARLSGTAPETAKALRESADKLVSDEAQKVSAAQPRPFEKTPDADLNDLIVRTHQAATEAARAGDPEARELIEQHEELARERMTRHLSGAEPIEAPAVSDAHLANLKDRLANNEITQGQYDAEVRNLSKAAAPAEPAKLAPLGPAPLPLEQQVAPPEQLRELAQGIAEQKNTMPPGMADELRQIIATHLSPGERAAGFGEAQLRNLQDRLRTLPPEQLGMTPEQRLDVDKIISMEIRAGAAAREGLSPVKGAVLADEKGQPIGEPGQPAGEGKPATPHADLLKAAIQNPDTMEPALNAAGKDFKQGETAGHAFQLEDGSIVDRATAGQSADANGQRPAELAGQPLQSHHLQPAEVGAAPRETPTDKNVWGKADPYLTEEQKGSVAGAFVERVTGLFNRFDTGKTIAAAKKGAFLKGWYKEMGEWMLDLFGPETPRFARVFGAFGANAGPVENTFRALNVWNTWVERGRPDTAEAVDKILEDTVLTEVGRGKGRTAKDMMAWAGNVRRALLTKDPMKIKLSGPKVDPYATSFLGDLDRAVLDRHMGIPYALQQGLSLTESMKKGSTIFGRRTVKTAEGDTLGVQGFPGMAYEAHLRHAAEIMSKRSGEPWKAGNIQEALWGYYQPFKMLSEEMGVKLDDLLEGKVKYSKARLEEFREKINPQTVLTDPRVQAEIARLERSNQPGGAERELATAAPPGEQPGAVNGAAGVGAGVGAEPSPVEYANDPAKGESIAGRLPPVDIGSRPTLTAEAATALDKEVDRNHQEGAPEALRPAKVKASLGGNGSPVWFNDGKLFYNPSALEGAVQESVRAGFTRDEAIRELLARHEVIHYNENISFDQAHADGLTVAANPFLADLIPRQYIRHTASEAERAVLMKQMTDTSNRGAMISLSFEAVEQVSRMLHDGSLTEDMYRKIPQGIVARVKEALTKQYRMLLGNKAYAQLSDAMKARVDRALEIRKLLARWDKANEPAGSAGGEVAGGTGMEAAAGNAPRGPPEGAMLNIGHNVGRVKDALTQDFVAKAVTQHPGVEITNHTIQKSGTENTSVVSTNRALTPDEAHKTSVALGQEAIAQSSGGTVALHGPQAEKWGSPDESKFLNHEGKSLTDIKSASRDEGPMVSGAGFLAPNGTFHPGPREHHESTARGIIDRNRGLEGYVTGQSAQRHIMDRGYVRVTTEPGKLLIEGNPSSSQLRILKESAREKKVELIHDIPLSKYNRGQRVLYSPDDIGAAGRDEEKPITYASQGRKIPQEEFDAVKERGRQQIAAMEKQGQETTGLKGAAWVKAKDNAFEASQKSWGGATIDPRTGEAFQPEKAEAGPFAVTAKREGQDSIRIPEKATRAEFEKAMEDAKKRFPQLSAADHYLGVFHDDKLGTIDIDPVVMAKTADQAEEIGAHTNAVGGAYDYATGNGLFPPVVGAAGREEAPKLPGKYDELLNKVRALNPPAATPAVTPEGPVGISQAAHEARFGSAIQPGEFEEHEAVIARGRQQIANGAKPEDRVTQLRNSGTPADKNDFALFLAHAEDLGDAARKAEAAGDAKALDAALAKDLAFRLSIKPLETQAGENLASLNIKTDPDTGSLVGMQEAFIDRHGRPMDEKQVVKAKTFVEKTKGVLKGAVAALSNLSNTFEAARVKAKQEALPTDAKSLRAYFQQQIASGTEFIIGAAKRAFTAAERQAIWGFAKANFIDPAGIQFMDLSKAADRTAAALGLEPDLVRDVFAGPKNQKGISDEVYRNLGRRNTVVADARQWIAGENMPIAKKVLSTIIAIPRTVAVFSHANAMITHAGKNLPVAVAEKILKTAGLVDTAPTWDAYATAFIKNFEFFWSKDRVAIHAAAMEQVVNDPMYRRALRAKLQVRPSAMEDYSSYMAQAADSPLLKGLGITDFLHRGNMAMDSLKVFRMEWFKEHAAQFNDLQGAEQKGADAAMASLANHISGYVDIGHGALPGIVRQAAFAPGLEASRWAWMGDYSKAVRTAASWDKSSPGDRAAVKVMAARAGQFAGTLVAALIANQAFLKATGSDQEINFLHPEGTDWMRFKAASHTFDPLGGQLQPLRLISRMAMIATQDKVNPADAVWSEVGTYLSGKATPAWDIGKELISGKTFGGKPLPWSNVKSKQDNITATELFLSHAPIPASEAARSFYDQIEGQVSPDVAAALMNATFAGAVGYLGVKEGAEPKRDWQPHR